jgi:hypothetical protein
LNVTFPIGLPGIITPATNSVITLRPKEKFNHSIKKSKINFFYQWIDLLQLEQFPLVEEK